MTLILASDDQGVFDELRVWANTQPQDVVGEEVEDQEEQEGKQDQDLAVCLADAGNGQNHDDEGSLPPLVAGTCSSGPRGVRSPEQQWCCPSLWPSRLNAVMENPLWDMLSVEVRAHVDALVGKNRRILAIKVIRDGFVEPRPGLYECMDLVAERYADLGQRFNRSPTAPLDLNALTAKVQALASRPAAIEAVWDGDTEGWLVELLAVTIEPRAAHHLAFIQFGTDMRLFNGEVPPWPEAEEASTVGQALAERFSLPFHFASPEAPDDAAPRWWDSR
jgi:hypothetical protein